MATIPIHTRSIRQPDPELGKPSSRVLYAERLKIHGISTQATGSIPVRKVPAWCFIANTLNL
jgi:hypothetical protein